MNHKDCCTLLKNKEDRDILTRKLFDVNLRLSVASPSYNSLVVECCEYIRYLATHERPGYKKPHGFSGANAGIPFNIIALANGDVMINPRIALHKGVKVSSSNCGSLLLDQPIEINRYEFVIVEYIGYDSFIDRKPEIVRVEGYLPTVQHEIDHNNGILITDRAVWTMDTLMED